MQPADGHDAAQRTWLQLIERHHEIREPEALGAWLRTRAHRECLQIIIERRRLVALDDVAGSELRDPAVDVEQAVVAETVRTLWGLLDRLPTRAAALVTALFGEDPRPYAEIARSAGIPVGSIGPTRAQALDLLRRRSTESRCPSGRVHCRA